MRGLRVIKIVKEIGFEGVWGELEVKKCFQGQSEAIIHRVFGTNSSFHVNIVHYGKKFNFCFSRVFF